MSSAIVEGKCPVFRVSVGLAVFILSVCALALGIALPLVHDLPMPEMDMGLRLCDVPCWAGLEPGRTPIDDVPAILQAYAAHSPVDVQPYERYTSYIVDAPTRQVLGAISAREGRVSMIRLDVAQPLWPLLVLLKAPRCIEPVESVDEGVVNIYWEIDGVYVMSNAIWSEAASEIMITSLNLWIPASTAPCDKYGQVLPWPGYAVFRRRS